MYHRENVCLYKPCQTVDSPLLFLSLGAVVIGNNDVWPMIRIYRGGFLLIEFLFLLGKHTPMYTCSSAKYIQRLINPVVWPPNDRTAKQQQQQPPVCLSVLSDLFFFILQESTRTAGGRQGSTMCSYLNSTPETTCPTSICLRYTHTHIKHGITNVPRGQIPHRCYYQDSFCLMPLIGVC